MSQVYRYAFISLVSLVLMLPVLICPSAVAEINTNLDELPIPTPNDQFAYIPLLDNQNASGSPGPRKHTPRVVLALGGGGMRGAAHIGVLKVLLKAGIPIDGIAGTSMGSIVGGLYAAGMPVSEIERRFVNGSLMKAFVPFPLGIRILMAPIISSPRLIGISPYDGLYYDFPFRHYLEHAITNKKTIESLNIPYCAVAIDLGDGHPYAIKKGNLIDAMQASSAVPGLRKPININGRLFVDGGILANLPVLHARALGGDIVIAVQVDEHFGKEMPDEFRKVGSVSKRTLNLQLTTLDAVYRKDADIVIHPYLKNVSLISTKVSDAKRSILAGEEAAEAALPLIKQKLQAFGIATISSEIKNN